MIQIFFLRPGYVDLHPPPVDVADLGKVQIPVSNLTQKSRIFSKLYFHNFLYT